jgi:hypothetical protein
MQHNVDACQPAAAVGDGGSTMYHTSAAVEAEEARPIAGMVHIADAGAEHPSHAVESEQAEAPWAVAVVFAAWHIADAEDAEAP